MPNNDYILRSDVINAACSDCYCCATIEEFETTSCPAKKKYMSIPAANVEPVVRCENCQFFEIVEYWPDGTKKVCQLLKRQVQENSFCCWGMKKEAEDG